MTIERAALLWATGQPLLRGAAPALAALPSRPRRRTGRTSRLHRIAAAFVRRLFSFAVRHARGLPHRRGRP